ncbi:hypothetical protein [Streptomyces canus]|uniref:hypothetical protein n=1 Tax=Streptomyces canus TaxID=58343 RepID=UPI003248A6F7
MQQQLDQRPQFIRDEPRPRLSLPHDQTNDPAGRHSHDQQLLLVAHRDPGARCWGLAGLPAPGRISHLRHPDLCKSHDLNIDILGEVGILNGLGGNLINGEGSPGAQSTDIGSDCGHGW